MTIDDDDDAIVLAIANRTALRDVARAYGLTVKEIDAIVERRAAEMFDGAK